jgi:hypothetical protein
MMVLGYIDIKFIVNDKNWHNTSVSGTLCANTSLLLGSEYKTLTLSMSSCGSNIFVSLIRSLHNPPAARTFLRSGRSHDPSTILQQEIAKIS